MTTKLPNPQRNELTIKLGDKSFLVRPTFGFIVEVEEYFDSPLTTLVLEKLQTGKIKALELAAIIAAGVRGAGKEVSDEEIQEAIAAAGTVVSIDAILPLLMNAFSGADKIAKKN